MRERIRIGVHRALAPRAPLAWLWLGVLACCGASGCGDGERGGDAGRASDAPIASAASSEARGPLIVFLGDSITAGYGLAAAEAYPALVQSQLAGEGTPVRIVNAGVSGDTSAGGLARLDWMLRQRPNCVVVALGGNDGLRGLSTEELERNLTQIVRRSQDAGARVLLAGMQMPPSHGEDYARAFAAVYPRVAQATGATLLPFLLEGVGGDPGLNQSDGIHPNADGQARVARSVRRALEPLLADG